MPYEKQNWINNPPSATTPISASRLSHLETQYDEAVEELSPAISALTDLTDEGRLSEEGLTATVELLTFVVDTSYASLEEAFAALAPGGVMEVRGQYSRGTTFTVNKACTIRWAQGGSITTTSASITAIDVTADNVTLDRPLIIGTGASSSTGCGIRCIGASAASTLKNLRVFRGAIQNFTQYGIRLDFVEGFEISGGTIQNISYAGIMVLSSSKGSIKEVNVKDINVSAGLANSYGVAISRAETTSSLDTYPRSKEITVENCIIENVPWEGLDTHAGERIKFINNTVLKCKTAIACVGSSSLYAPLNMTVANNILDAQVTDGSAGVGVLLVGAPGAIGSPIELASGQITGNTILNHGGEITGLGGVLAYVTRGVVITNNIFVECVANGICLYYDNYGFVVENNTILDVWCNTVTQAAAIRLRSTYNVGVIAHNSTMRGAKSATHVMEYGLYVQDTATTTVNTQLGPNDWSGVTTNIVDTARRANYRLDASEVTVGKSSGRIAFYGGTAVVKPTGTPAAATDPTTTQALVNSLRAALVSLGAIS